MSRERAWLVQRRLYNFVEGLRFLVSGPLILNNAYLKASGRPFAVPTPGNEVVMVSSERHLAEVNKAHHSQLSLHAVAKELLQPKHTMRGFQWQDERGVEGTGFVRALRSLLTAHLPSLQPRLEEVIAQSVDQYVQGCKSNGCLEAHAEVHVFDMVKKIVTRANCLMFFGEQFSGDPVFLEAALKYPEDVFITAEILRSVPRIFRGPLGMVMTLQGKAAKRLFDSLMPEVAKRLDLRARHNGSPEYSKKKPVDCMQWLIDTSPSKIPWTPQRMSFEIMAVWFSSVHQLAMATTYALEDLCLHPEYAEPLRREIHQAAKASNRSTDGKRDPSFPVDLDLSKLELLDSFISESSRLSPLDAVSMRRKALVDYTFSDGTFVAKGNWVCFPQAAMMRDPQYWDDADSFDGFRFANVEAVERTASHSAGAEAVNGTVSRAAAAKRATTQAWKTEMKSCAQSRSSGAGEKFTDINHRRLIWGGGDKTW
ncbi:MAG: hypothetical protein M1831_006906 [Alyxoria varia]|nr:MAG: hypothetical protein M1831_006906 [Alyxoria varia]